MTTSEYERVKDIVTREEFESRVKGKVGKWAGLLDERAATLLVLDELGRLEVPFDKIKDIRDGQEVSVCAKVESIGQVRNFTRKTGESGRVVNVELNDGTGKCRLALWDDDVKMVEQGYVRVGSIVRALDCFARESSFGLELGRGKFGSIIAVG